MGRKWLHFGNHCFATKIDIVAENKLDQQALFVEVKRNVKNYNPELLNEVLVYLIRVSPDDIFCACASLPKDSRWCISRDGFRSEDLPYPSQGALAT